VGLDLQSSFTRAAGWLAEAGGAFASLVFPAPCRVCEGVLLTASRVPICQECLASFVPIPHPICNGCGRAIVSERVGEAPEILCRLCRLGVYAFTRARSYGVYEDAMVRAVVLLKYEPIVPLARWFANRLAEVFRREAESLQADLLVPVPLHRDRQSERGYNQAELIARPLALALKIHYDDRVLVRTKPRPDRRRLSLHQRWAAVRGAYAIRPGSRVDNLRVLLVDDVMTTGATLDACARALRKSGAAAVTALTVARALRIGPVAPVSVPREQGPRLERDSAKSGVGSYSEPGKG
jgi:ComF family protein